MLPSGGAQLRGALQDEEGAVERGGGGIEIRVKSLAQPEPVSRPACQWVTDSGSAAQLGCQ
jgi:hypothetical protein